MVALVQGVYFFVTGIWPIFSINSFQRVTGPKTDLWLANTVGVILTVIGLTLLFAYITFDISPSIALLAVGSAFSLAVVECIYVAKRVILPIYLGDVFIELVLIGWWLLSLRQIL